MLGQIMYNRIWLGFLYDIEEEKSLLSQKSEKRSQSKEIITKLNYNKYLFNFDNVSPRRYLQISIRTKEAIFRDETG